MSAPVVRNLRAGAGDVPLGGPDATLRSVRSAPYTAAMDGNTTSDASRSTALHQRVAQPGDLQRLLALRAATTDAAPVYLAILSAMAAAKVSYQLQLRTDDVVAAVDAIDIDRSRAADALRQLQEWGCVTWVQDTTFSASTVEEYLRRHELWELTPIGESTMAAVALVLGASERSGALQSALFRQITESLDGLREAVLTGEAQRTYLELRTLSSAVDDLAHNARDFHATINRIAREDRLEQHVFLLYKEELIAYLQSFHDDLVRNRVTIVRQLATLDADYRTRLLQLAAEGDDSIGMFGDAADWQPRWDGMRAWFIATPPATSGIAQLASATTVAIRELLALLRRLTEATARPIDRASELTHLARWFARLESDHAHALFDVAFGLGGLTHLSIGSPDPDRVSMSTSWWTAEPAPVPVTLREYGKRASPGRPAQTADFAQAKRYLDDRRRAEGIARTEAVGVLRTVDLSRDRLSAGTWAYLLELIDRAMANRDLGVEFTATAVDDSIELTVTAEPGSSTRLLSEHGELVVHGCSLVLRKIAIAR